MVRERSAELFAKMMSDKLIGPKVKIVLSKFLPAIFMDAMRDSAQASVHMFEGKKLLVVPRQSKCALATPSYCDQSFFNCSSYGYLAPRAKNANKLYCRAK